MLAKKVKHVWSHIAVGTVNPQLSEFSVNRSTETTALLE